MPISENRLQVLQKIAEKMPENSKWATFGSIDSDIRGIDVNPNDIDLIATEETAEKFREIFSNSFVSSEPLDISQIDEYNLQGEEVEVIYSRSEEEKQEPLVDWESLELEESDTGVPLLPLDHIISAYEKIDKTERAEELQQLE